MANYAYILLSADSRLRQAVSAALRSPEILVTSCLQQLKSIESSALLIVDPRAVGICCLDRLLAWRRRRGAGCLAILELSSPAGIALGLERILRSPWLTIDQLPSALRNLRPAIRRASVWAERTRILSPAGNERGPRLFLAFARSRDHQPCTVREAATDIGFSVRQLNRLAGRWFGHPPGILLDLARIASVAHDLEQTSHPIERIAENHGFYDSSTLSREFLGFVGLRPGAYRAWVAAQNMAENAIDALRQTRHKRWQETPVH
ncbi:MAG TPA: helix-turn-helix domain-containing protein, partial [Candidatus Polarisedimenticolia bacterium]|nr:helix-turn-helix domain-containing protein [Candidatus Polarisedimenticolia bacterium]